MWNKDLLYFANVKCAVCHHGIECSDSEANSQTCFFICANISRKFMCRSHVTSQMKSLKNSVQVTTIQTFIFNLYDMR